MNTITTGGGLIKGILGAMTGVLTAMTVLSGGLLAYRLTDYIKIDDREVVLETNLSDEIDLFSADYENESGDITVSATDGESVIAPGTAVDYSIRLRNKDRVALDYELSPSVTFFSEEYRLPILVRMVGPDSKYVLGDAKTWVSIDELNTFSTKGTLLKGESTEYVFQWKWDFEGDDEYDTLLGTGSVEESIGLSASITVSAVGNPDVKANGGFFRSDVANIVTAASSLTLGGTALGFSIMLLVKSSRALPCKAQGNRLCEFLSVKKRENG